MSFQPLHSSLARPRWEKGQFYDLENRLKGDQPYFEVLQSGLQEAGRGLFCRTPYDKNEVIILYTGQRLDKCVLDKTYEQDQQATYCVQIGTSNIYIDSRNAADSSMARFANSLRPDQGENNAVFIPDALQNVWLVATRQIKAGEEIFVDYGQEYWAGETSQRRGSERKSEEKKGSKKKSSGKKGSRKKSSEKKNTKEQCDKGIGYLPFDPECKIPIILEKLEDQQVFQHAAIKRNRILRNALLAIAAHREGISAHDIFHIHRNQFAGVIKCSTREKEKSIMGVLLRFNQLQPNNLKVSADKPHLYSLARDIKSFQLNLHNLKERGKEIRKKFKENRAKREQLRIAAKSKNDPMAEKRRLVEKAKSKSKPHRSPVGISQDLAPQLPQIGTRVDFANQPFQEFKSAPIPPSFGVASPSNPIATSSLNLPPQTTYGLRNTFQRTPSLTTSFQGLPATQAALQTAPFSTSLPRTQTSSPPFGIPLWERNPIDSPGFSRGSFFSPPQNPAVSPTARGDFLFGSPLGERSPDKLSFIAQEDWNRGIQTNFRD